MTQQRESTTIAASTEYSVEDSPLGRVVVAQAAPRGYALFYTTSDFDGRLTSAVSDEISSYIRARFGIESSLTTCTQVHGKTVTRAHHAPQWRECEACDALWSTEPRVALGTKVADCLPVTMIDPVHGVMANVHSGWRGTVQRITAATIDEIERDAAFDAREASVFLGPSIRVCCFEVGEEVAMQFDESYVDRSFDKPHVDVVRFTIDQLRARGFRDDGIHDSRLCTRCDGSIFHSYRRGRTPGERNLAIVAH